jgi:hypothetical protein
MLAIPTPEPAPGDTPWRELLSKTPLLPGTTVFRRPAADGVSPRRTSNRMPQRQVAFCPLTYTRMSCWVPQLGHACVVIMRGAEMRRW